MRRLAALLALALLLSLAAPAFAGYPKRGVYIDTKLQVYVTVGKSRTSVTALNAPCVFKNTAGVQTSSGGFVLPKSKHPKISSAGKFSYKGNVTLNTGYSKSVVPVEVKGSFANGKLKGTVALDQTKTACEPYSYSGKNYGVNPQG